MKTHLVRCMAVAAILAGTVTYTAAGGGPFTRGCAARDMRILMMLEQRESANDIVGQELNEVLVTIFNARTVCSEGHVMDALEMYDDITRRIISGRVAAGRNK